MRPGVGAMADASGSTENGETAETRISTLTPDERRILTALAVVGQASLSEEELAAVTEPGDVTSTVADLQRRGLVRQDEQQRYSLLGRIGAELRETDQALATGERLAGYLTTLAHAGDLSPARLVQDAEAILGLSEWAAEHEQWNQLLELVQTTQACFSIARRIDQWISLLRGGRAAAQALGDRDAEVQILHQLATAHSVAGDAEAAQRSLREADEVQRRGRPPSGRPRARDETRLARTAAAETGRRVPRIALWAAGLIAAAGAGLGAGWAVAGSDNGSVGPTTVEVPVTVTVSGQTITTTKETTLPAETVTTTTTVISTTTTTVTTTPPPPPVG